MKPTIALVGGRDIDRHLILVTLGTADWRVIEARSTTDLIALATAGTVDVILAITSLSGHSGGEDLAAICQRLRASPVTGRAKIGVLHEPGRRPDVESGADVYFVRPFSPTELLNCVHAAVGPGDRSSAM